MKYKALNPVRHNGTLYAEGETLELDGKTAESLLACGAVALGEEAEKAEKAVKVKVAKPVPEEKEKGKKSK